MMSNTPIEQLLAEYTAEECDFTDMEWVIRTSQRYVDSMEDCQVRCLLHTLVEQTRMTNELL